MRRAKRASFVSLNASRENFAHKTLKDEQIPSQNRIPREICFGGATDGIRQERYISVNSKSVVSYGQYSQRQIKNPPLFIVGLQRGTVPLPINTLDAQR